MSLSMKYLFAVSLIAGVFEAASTVVIEQPLASAAFAVVFLACAWGLWRRQSLVATVVVGVFLLVDVGAVPFYDRHSVGDALVQLVFAAVGIVGLFACGHVLRERRRMHAAA
jgi:hypothetical protein